jgi:hypothetical protein
MRMLMDPSTGHDRVVGERHVPRMEKATSPPFPRLLYLELTCFDERDDLITHPAFSILPLQNGSIAPVKREPVAKRMKAKWKDLRHCDPSLLMQ